MTITTLAFTGPTIDAAQSSDLPVLRFYTKYVKEFVDIPDSIPLERYFHPRCRMYHVDRSILEGSENIWQWVTKLYSPFPKVTREFLTMIVVSDDETGIHRMHMEIVTSLHLGEGKSVVDLPQSFVYTLGKADEGKGTEGLQFKELRNYYDYSLIEKAQASL